MGKFNIVTAATVALFLSACSSLSNYNVEICISIMESQFESFWIESFSPIAKMEPDSCSMIVATRLVTNNEDYNNLFSYELSAKYKVFESGDFSYTHEINRISIEQAPIIVPSKKRAIAGYRKARC